MNLLNQCIVSALLRSSCGYSDQFYSTQTPAVPLCQGEFACRAADLVLVEAGNQFSAQFDVGTTVASLLIIV